jgi:hypothetical protein
MKLYEVATRKKFHFLIRLQKTAYLSNLISQKIPSISLHKFIIQQDTSDQQTGKAISKLSNPTLRLRLRSNNQINSLSPLRVS